MQAFDQQGEPAGRARFPTLGKVNPFCRELFKQAQELKAGKLESYLLWRDAAPALCSRSCRDCLLAARAQGLPTFPLLCQDPQVRCPTGRSLAPLQASGFSSPGLAEVRRSPARGAAAPGSPTRTPTEAVALGAGPRPPQTWPTALRSAVPRKREGALVGPVWKGPWGEGTSQRGPWVIFKSLPNQLVIEDTATRRGILSQDQCLPVLWAYLAQSVSFCTFFPK